MIFVTNLSRYLCFYALCILSSTCTLYTTLQVAFAHEFDSKWALKVSLGGITQNANTIQPLSIANILVLCTTNLPFSSLFFWGGGIYLLPSILISKVLDRQEIRCSLLIHGLYFSLRLFLETDIYGRVMSVKISKCQNGSIGARSWAMESMCALHSEFYRRSKLLSFLSNVSFKCFLQIFPLKCFLQMFSSNVSSQIFLQMFPSNVSFKWPTCPLSILRLFETFLHT